MPTREPHVFIVDELYVSDGKYVRLELEDRPERKIENNRNLINLEKTTIIFAHGIKRNGK